MESTVKNPIKYPELRQEVVEALQALSDREYQLTRWGRFDPGVNYYDDLTLNVHILYDDCTVFPEPEESVPELLYDDEIPALQALHEALWPMIEDLGERPDVDYISDPRWSLVMATAHAALAVMKAHDSADS